MKKLKFIVLLPLLSSCSSVNDFVDTATTNPFKLLTGGKSLPELTGANLKNPYLAKLKGVHISELENRGIVMKQSGNRYYLQDFNYSWGSGDVTNTYAVYSDGSRRLINSKMDGGVLIGEIWFETDDDGFITDYQEMGNRVQKLDNRYKQRLADLLNRKN